MFTECFGVKIDIPLVRLSHLRDPTILTGDPADVTPSVLLFRDGVNKYAKFYVFK